MIKLINDWYTRHFSDPQVAILAFLLLLGFGVIYFAGNLLTPLFAAVIIAYLLDGAVEFLRRFKIPQFIAMIFTFSLFILFLLVVIFILAPLMFKQTTQFMLEIPRMLAEGQSVIMMLPEKYPHIISQEFVGEILTSIKSNITALSQKFVSLSVASVVDVFSFMVYLVVVPLLVFFFLKDKKLILSWFRSFLPRDRALVATVWSEVNGKITGYVRGKFMEILIIWVISYITFLIFDLNYALLLSFTVGISVLIPYVGAIAVTLPVAIVAYFQWGYSYETVYVLTAYAIIQFLDGNLLVPLLFSEMVNLHPAAIIMSVLVFGGLWGVWGVFFAIPLATLVHSVMNSWPRRVHNG
ncbi:AI-2E family transporter [Leucothrix pacifica]|uniref:AI-2E family transporter n=1 Tax=Leucothrix pacifica TaxID=1247513 RepID=A0A317CC06_9GAMM|nr:AI-2E family transporter [Leucothrix pacifica]PWQ96088.1 AI-2E family transporter [Leucothrix pacifica]